jgi:DNA-binding NarL/FixJ family response regulator
MRDQRQISQTMPIRIAIVEDHEDIRKLTASLLNFYPDMECVSSFGDAESFRQSLPALRPDVVLMDIGLPGQSGIECVRACKDETSDPEGIGRRTEFIMFTDHTDTKEVFEALKAGAAGYVLKGGTPERLAEAVRDVVEGGSPMSRQISRMVTEYFRSLEKKDPELEKLTEQEKIVLDYLEQGLAYKQIAAARFVSEHTVRTQVRSIYRKLQVHNRTEALNKRKKG